MMKACKECDKKNRDSFLPEIKLPKRYQGKMVKKRQNYDSLTTLRNLYVENMANYPKADPRLENWDIWAERRKNLCAKLAKFTERPSVDLVMNSEVNVREREERKRTIQLAELTAKAPLRDSLWEQPQRLFQKCKCPCEPVYEIHRTIPELGIIPTLEYVGVPEGVRPEKGICGKSTHNRCADSSLLKSKYKAFRESCLKDKIKLIEPHKPELEDLMVIGTKPRAPTPPPVKPPIVTVSAEEGITRPTQIDDIYALRVNDSLFMKEKVGKVAKDLREMIQQPWHVKTRRWRYFFTGPINEKRCKMLKLTNLGTMNIRYSWRRLDSNAKYVPTIKRYPAFFFNKNDALLTPGQSREVKLWFATDYPGIYTEMWELIILNVKLFAFNSYKLRVFLEGNAIETGDDKEIKRLMDNIDTRTNNRMAREIVNEIFRFSEKSLPTPYPYKNLFLEGDIFILKNPVCFYHQTEVQSLKNLYAEIDKSNEKYEWDLSVRAIRNTIMKQNLEIRPELYNILKESYSVLLEPWDEDDDLNDAKLKAVSSLLGRYFDLFFYESCRLLPMYICEVEGYNVSKSNVKPSQQERSSQKSSKVINQSRLKMQRSSRGLVHKSRDNRMSFYSKQKVPDAKPSTKLNQSVVLPTASAPGYLDVFYMVMKEHLADLTEDVASLIDSVNTYRRLEFQNL